MGDMIETVDDIQQHMSACARTFLGEALIISRKGIDQKGFGEAALDIYNRTVESLDAETMAVVVTTMLMILASSDFEVSQVVK